MGRSAQTTNQHIQGAAIETLYPGGRELEADLPERAKKYLEQALNSLAAPDGVVMLAGSAVDAMLKARGLTEGSHYARIEKAVKSGLLTQEMADWAHDVRLGSNKPRHADEEDPHMTPEDATRLIDFAAMLGHILFTLPARVQKRASIEGG